jgi:hypothetical protein
VAAVAGKRRPFASPEKLWPSGSRLRRGDSAFFLLLTPGEGDDLGKAQLDAVWIDGVEVEIGGS